VSADLWIRKRWSRWLREHRLGAKMSKLQLATEVGCDPALLTLMERDGHVPRREKVRGIGRVFGCVAEAELSAGYLPASASRSDQERIWRGCLAAVVE